MSAFRRREHARDIADRRQSLGHGVELLGGLLEEVE
jgi:hypothetical protein